MHLLGDLALRLLDRAAEVAVAHAELDRQIAFLALAIDIGGAGHELDVGDFVERDLGDAVRALRADAEVLDRFRVLPELRGEPHYDGEVPVAAGLVEVAGGFAADSRSNRGIDVARRETIARRARPIDLDLHRRLAERCEDGEVGYAGHRSDHCLDLVGSVGQRLQIVAEQLDRVLAFDARYRLGDVVL